MQMMMRTGNRLVHPLMVMDPNQCPGRVKPKSTWIHRTTRLLEMTDPVQVNVIIIDVTLSPVSVIFCAVFDESTCLAI